ncbi:hypothetical protein [Microbacterium sp. H83]|uniref:hypothetical protein n=1 Tax=Microbacterium sp. H83 TaxID=1827324 RepID=UPI0007F375D8|nr:hypothetical protein [Microbacterium sp. H83]OAN40989.1 hypothetical protein A4X16_02330 [Microbacterium sp. H83]
MAVSRRDGMGADARFSRLAYSGPLRGARLTVRYSPDDALRLAVDQLVAQGFVVRQDGFDERLRAEGSAWQAVSLEIGDAKRSKRTFWTGLIADEFPFPLPKALQHSIPPTLVVATARQAADGTTELVVFPHASRDGDPEYSWAAAPRISAAVEAMTATATSSAALVDHETMRGIANDGCPASQQVVRDLLGWR